MPSKKMEARVVAIEVGVTRLKASIAEFRAQAKANHERLVSLFIQSKILSEADKEKLVAISEKIRNNVNKEFREKDEQRTCSSTVTETIEESVTYVMKKTIDGKDVEEEFNKVGEKPRREDRVVEFDQWLPPKLSTPPPELLKPSPEPSVSWPPARVPPQRAPRIKSPFLGFPLCVDVFLTKQSHDLPERPPPEPPDASSLMTVTGLIVKSFCVHVAKLDVVNVLEKVGSCGPLDLASTNKSHSFKDITIRVKNPFQWISVVNSFQTTTPCHVCLHLIRADPLTQICQNKDASCFYRLMFFYSQLLLLINNKIIPPQAKANGLNTSSRTCIITFPSSNYPNVVEKCESSSRGAIHCHFVKDRGKLFNGFMINCPKDIYCNYGFFGCVGKLFEVLEGNYTGLGNSLISRYERHEDDFKVIKISSQVLQGGAITNERVIKFVFGDGTQRGLYIMLKVLVPTPRGTIHVMVPDDGLSYYYLSPQLAKQFEAILVVVDRLQYDSQEGVVSKSQQIETLSGLRQQEQAIHLVKEQGSVTNLSLEVLLVSMSYLTGTISEVIGRLSMLITSSIILLFKGLVMLWDPNVHVMLFSRLFSDVVLALSMILTLLYISEIVLPDIRGLLNALAQFPCPGGMFAAYFMDIKEPQFPSLSLEDKAGFHGAGSDSAPPNKPNKGKAVIWRV